MPRTSQHTALSIGAKPMTGFINRSSSTLGMSGGNFQITVVGSSYDVYSGGTKYTKSTTQSIGITNDLTLHYVYFNTSGVIQVSTSAWDITSDNIPIAMVYKDGSTYVIYDERHSAYRDKYLHAMLHKTVGARYDVATGGLTGTFTNTTLSLTRGTIYDEDLANDTGATKTTANLYYRNAGLTAMRVELASARPYKDNGVAPYALRYDNAGTLTAVGVGNYVNSWVYGTNDVTNPIAVVVGQSQNASLPTIRTEALPSILMTTLEWKLLYRVTYRNVGGTATYVENADFRTSSSLPSGGAPAVNASSVTFVPYGNISSTNVQSALEELDDEKAAVGHIHNGVDGTSKLAQANTHESADTDSAPTALHHTLGTGANQACAGNDSRLSNSRTPTGSASGDLGGTYPGPTVTDLTIASEAAGDMLYFNGSNWVRVPNGAEGQKLQYDDTLNKPIWKDDILTFTFAVTGALTTGNDKAPIWLLVTENCTVTKAYATVKTPPTGQAITIAISRSAFNDQTFATDVVTSGNLQIAATAYRGSTTTITNATLTEGQLLAIDIDQIGSGTAGSDLVIELVAKRRIN